MDMPKEVTGYECATCGRVHLTTIYACRFDQAREAAISAAQKCCATPLCKRCGCELESRTYTACNPCREVLKLERAKVVLYSNCGEAPVFSDSSDGDWGEGYFSDLAEVAEWCHGHGEPLPAYVHPCKATDFQFDPANIIDHVHDNHHEDAVDQINDQRGLFDFFKEWNAKQTLRSYYPISTEVIILDDEAFDAILRDAPAPLDLPTEGET